MTSISLMRVAALATAISAGMSIAAVAQTTATDPHHPDAALAQAAPPATAEQSAQPGQGGMMPPGMMAQGMMGQSMMGGMMQPGMMGGMPMMPMRGQMMKIGFAIADTNGDGGISFDELTTIHKRIFDKVDVDKDGRVTPEEVQTFMRE
ncbi:EF-hand domain-containing protein [Mesorhizobium sp. L-8-3]|uniref:EF-hand domain-containing protein n=1 Tax=Mesorhizobium sp. L-8-3 TaxID=2744522 RepID=UPI001926B138|nr:EF-hand domain-containing protein [Mesorhizobium sp. L-8-3]BCH25056.1 hypothetical protein MesoLjLb_48410 [Mesorhizobium sp. L-8-3]